MVLSGNGSAHGIKQKTEECELPLENLEIKLHKV